MFKLLTFVLLFFAVAIAMALLMRLTRIQQQIAERTKELQKNNEEMARQRLELERLAARQDANPFDQDLKT